MSFSQHVVGKRLNFKEKHDKNDAAVFDVSRPLVCVPSKSKGYVKITIAVSHPDLPFTFYIIDSPDC